MMHSSKKHIARRIVVYSLMITISLTLATSLLLIMLGYRFNQSSQQFVQGGLVQFISQPSGASVKVGTADLANRTRSKITLNPGDYRVKMMLDGYRDWQKDITVKAGTVQWLNSAQFVPLNPETTAVYDMSSLGSVAMQEEGRRIALIEKAVQPTITLINTNDDQPEPKQITLSPETYTGGEKHRFTLETLSGDNRHLTLRHTVDDDKQWMMVDMDDPSRSYVIAKSSGQSVIAVQFDPSSNSRAYVQYADGAIRSLSISDGRLSEVIVGDVNTFSLTSEGELFYTTRPTNGSVSTGYVSQGKTVGRTLASYATDVPVRIAAGEYYGTIYVVTSVGKTTKIEEFSSYPESDSITDIVPLRTRSIDTPNSISFLSFKADGRLIALQQARAMTTYDLDLEKTSNIPLVGQKTDLKEPLEWLNSFHFWSDAGSLLRQYEFDGTNQETITTVTSGYMAAYSQNKKYMYTISKNEQGVSLQQTLMVL